MGRNKREGIFVINIGSGTVNGKSMNLITRFFQFKVKDKRDVLTAKAIVKTSKMCRTDCSSS